MKIGLFTDTYYPEINGVATSCLSLKRELTRLSPDYHWEGKAVNERMDAAAGLR